MIILSHADTRALCLGMAQLIPVFLVVLFVLDSLWIKQSFEQRKREIVELQRETEKIIAQRFQLDHSVARSLMFLNTLNAALRLKKAITFGQQRRKIQKGQLLLNDARTKLRDAKGDRKTRIQRFEESRARTASVLKDSETKIDAWMQIYNRLIIFSIISGLYGEIIAIWGAVGLVENTGVIASSVGVSIGMAGILSAIAMDRLMWDAPSKILSLVRTVWVACVTASVIVSWYWVMTSVSIRG